MELIAADSSFRETGEISCFIRFDAQIGLSTENADNDFELTMDENIWGESPIECGGYIYVPDTGWGGRVEKIIHSASDGRMRICGTCWRGLLDRFAVLPPEGETHYVVDSVEANSMLSAFLGRGPAYVSVDTADSGIVCSGKIRYKSLLSAAETLLSEQNARLTVSFSDGIITIGAESSVDYSGRIEFSQEYNSSLTSTKQGEMYNHIIALGQGTLENREIVSLWRLPSGKITKDPSAEGIPEEENLSTYIYDYSGVESGGALEEAARRKLMGLGETSSLEISVGESDAKLELGDIAGVRDLLTGMYAPLRVSGIRLVIEENSVKITHTLS